MSLDLIRITHPIELLAVEKQVRPLFKAYYDRAKEYLGNLESPEVAWKNNVTKSLFPDYYLYLIKDGEKFIGFYAGCLLRMPGFTVLYTMDYYIPGKGVEFSKILKAIMKVIGADEIWGEAPENICRVYRRVLPKATIKKVSMVRIRL